MKKQTNTLVMEKYCGKTKKFTFWLQMTGSEQLTAIFPLELFENDFLRSQLSIEQRERVAYIAGLEYGSEIAKRIAEIKKKSTDNNSLLKSPKCK
jgi:hypothetical protein